MSFPGFAEVWDTEFPTDWLKSSFARSERVADERSEVPLRREEEKKKEKEKKKKEKTKKKKKTKKTSLDPRLQVLLYSSLT